MSDRETKPQTTWHTVFYCRDGDYDWKFSWTNTLTSTVLGIPTKTTGSVRLAFLQGLMNRGWFETINNGCYSGPMVCFVTLFRRWFFRWVEMSLSTIETWQGTVYVGGRMSNRETRNKPRDMVTVFLNRVVKGFQAPWHPNREQQVQVARHFHRKLYIVVGMKQLINRSYSGSAVCFVTLFNSVEMSLTISLLVRADFICSLPSHIYV